MDRTVIAPDGRALQVAEAGDPAGHPVLVHNGAPSSRLLFAPHSSTAAACGVRLISYDRPGYGGSTRAPGRSIADAAADVRAITDALGIRRLGVWGFSTGGPHALACAALLPPLVTAAVVLASWGPFGAEGLDYFAGMSDDDADDVRMMLEDPDSVRPVYESQRTERLEMTVEALAARVGGPAGRGFADYRVRTFQSGLAPGVDGWYDDDWALLQPWGFEVDSITVPVLLRHGRRDQAVNMAHGQWLAAHIPRVEAHFSDDDHVGLFLRRPREDYEWLLKHPR